MKKNDVTVGAKSLKPKKEKCFGKIFITFIIGICLGGIVMYYYLDIYKEKDNKKDTTNNSTLKTDDNEKNNVKDLSANSYLVNRLISGMHYNDGTNGEKTLYINKKSLAKELDENYLDMLMMKEAFRKNKDFSNKVTVRNLEEARTNLFGKNYEVVIHTDKEIGNCPTFEYSSSDKTYTKQNSNCNITNDINIKYETLKATIKEKEEVNIYEVVAFIKDNKIYKSIDGFSNVSNEIKDADADEFDIKSNKDKLSQFKYNFKYDSNTDNYVFDSIELVK